MNNQDTFSFRVHGGGYNHIYEHIRTDASHAATMCKALSLTLSDVESISVSSHARNWLTYTHGKVTSRREWSQFYHHDYDAERELGIMFQNAPTGSFEK